MLLAALGSIVRAGVGWVFSWLVKAGIWQPSEAETYISGATIFILTAGWGVWKSWSGRRKLLTALQWADASENQVTAHIAAGRATPPVSTPKDVAPDFPPAA